MGFFHFKCIKINFIAMDIMMTRILFRENSTIDMFTLKKRRKKRKKQNKTKEERNEMIDKN